MSLKNDLVGDDSGGMSIDAVSLTAGIVLALIVLAYAVMASGIFEPERRMNVAVTGEAGDEESSPTKTFTTRFPTETDGATDGH